MPHLHHQRQIALPWLARLRWLAVVGQITATLAAIIFLDLQLPLALIGGAIFITALSNLTLQIWIRFRSPPDWIVPAVILLDVCMLSVLLFLTGGTDNPFAIFYAIHVAMAVVTLGSRWAAFVVALSAAAYAGVFFFHRPLVSHDPIPPRIFEVGQWCSLTLVMLLIAYFIGRVMRSLRDRESELAAARESAQRSEHLASLTTLAAGAAHELGSPLGTIALAAKEIERGEDPQSLAEDAALIRREVDRCRAILDRMRVDVLEDADQRSGGETLAMLFEGLRIDLRPNDQPRLLIDSDQPADLFLSRSRVLRRAVGVMLHNAFDASPPEAAVCLLFRRDEKWMIFEVRDGGVGMSPAVLKRAGEPFFTTKPPGGGMGLGLFLVRLVAETYGGEFKLTSVVGGGTKSILQLPARLAVNGNEHVENSNSGGGRRSAVSIAAGKSAGRARA